MSNEFWPRDTWPITIIPHPSLLRRLFCKLTGGHRWAISFWTPDRNAEVYLPHDYCEKCWKFRDIEKREQQ